MASDKLERTPQPAYGMSRGAACADAVTSSGPTASALQCAASMCADTVQ